MQIKNNLKNKALPLWLLFSFVCGSPLVANAHKAVVVNDPGESLFAAQDYIFTDSARSDKMTGGRVERAPLQPGNGDIRITVDVPAFLLTLWQGEKEVATYYVGVGQKDFPILIGERRAEQIILNPDWIPPDSDWVRASKITPFKVIPASSPKNPLGKIKIPLGNSYLIHEAKGASDLGNLVSHGCVRVMRRDLFDLSQKIALAQSLAVTPKAFELARTNKKQRVINLSEPIEVDIIYDSMIVEGGILSIYPDVYDYKTNTVAKLREELQSYNVDTRRISDDSLDKMLKRVNSKQKFVVSLADVRTNRALTKGKNLPLTPQQAVKQAAKSTRAAQR